MRLTVSPSKQKPDASNQSHEDRRSIREKWGIVVAIFVLATSVGQWIVFRQQLQIGNAASVSLTGMGVENFGGKAADGDLYWLFIPKIENSGNTPTQHLVMRLGNEQILTGPVTDEGVWDNIWKNNKFSTIYYTSIGPHVTIPGYVLQITGDFLNDMIAGKTAAYFVGDITYDDVFGASHVTQFCISAQVPIRNYREPIDRTVQVAIAQCRAHNCMDDECRTPLRPRPR